MGNLAELSIAGRVAPSTDPDWDMTRQAWSLAADQHPRAVALVESEQDVARVIGFAARNGLKVSGQGTGHGGPEVKRRWDPDGMIRANHAIAPAPA
jgi:hypothetical protein